MAAHKPEHVEPSQPGAGKKAEGQTSVGTAKEQYHEAKQMHGQGDTASAPQAILNEKQLPIIEGEHLPEKKTSIQDALKNAPIMDVKPLTAEQEAHMKERMKYHIDAPTDTMLPIEPRPPHPVDPIEPRPLHPVDPIPEPGGDQPWPKPHPEPFPSGGDFPDVDPEHHMTGMPTPEQMNRWEAQREAEKCGDGLSEKQKKEVAEGLAAILNHDDKALAEFLKNATPEERAAFKKGLQDLGYKVTETTSGGPGQSTTTDLTIAKVDKDGNITYPRDVTHVHEDDKNVRWDPTRPHPHIHMQPTIEVLHDRSIE